MPDDLDETQPEDGRRVNVNQPYEVEYWTDRFDTTEDELRDAVDDVGTDVDDVEDALDDDDR